MEGYISSAYDKSKASFNVACDPEDTDTITVQISCHNKKLESFWSGEWLTTWTISGGNMSASIKVKCHYFESGNLQFNLDKTADSVAVKDFSKGHSIVDGIKAFEDKVSCGVLTV